MPENFWAGVGGFVQSQGGVSLLPASDSCPALLPSPTVSSRVFLFQVPAIEENLLDDKHLLKPWDAKKVGMAHCPSSFHGAGLQGSPLSSVLICHLLPFLLSCPRPLPDLGPVKSLELSKYSVRSAEVGRAVKGTVGCWVLLFADHCPHLHLVFFPSIFPSPDQPATVPVLPPAMNTGGSLPDLTNLHFPPPLPTPLDPEETAYPSLSGGSSTSNLTHTMTHLGISGGLALGPGYDAPGEWLSWLRVPGVLSSWRDKGVGRSST